ncbi:hypothetical protein H6F98_01035 [Microcoleus sp. FACHB-SPT15]|uniref:hypothetical protein n=1 Tax=Microcoleus sp. FACHB-SPT15 TaxID=2692830 RepID=UPI00177F1A04|nr:hypothetical protein [Microcoleus sp. FACHB-SPT15]MBD1804059.1 hypothetical protein [Microcoleus sp. FACHB-SPT15]
MKAQISEVRWKRVLIGTGIGTVIVLVTFGAYDTWRRRDGWCVQYYPDGSEKVLYGAECQQTEAETRQMAVNKTRDSYSIRY